MNIDAYQAIARTTALYPRLGANTQYPSLGLTGETGEVLEKFEASADDMDSLTDEQRSLFAKEFGDVLWYAASLASELGHALSLVARCEEFAELTSADPTDDPWRAALLLGAAAGGIAERAKKVERDQGGVLDDTSRELFTAALRTVLERLGDLARLVGVDLDAAAQQNADKLADRMRRSVIQGSGDAR